jgi:TatD DNase family protein
MIDTHCHLTDPRLLEQLEAVLSRAQSAGVTGMVSVATHPADWPAALELANTRGQLRCAIGVHPNYCHQVELDELPQLRGLQNHPSVVALGEMGLDYHYEYAPKSRQAQFLEAQLQIADELKRPVIIHCREAADDCLAILNNFSSVSAVFHCFTGSADEARRIWDRGYLLGFTGVVTFKNGQALRDIAAAVPVEQILVETDAPYLTPEPMRKQKVNEPALVMHTAAVVAQARGVSLEEIDAITTKNAQRFYRWDNQR